MTELQGAFAPNRDDVAAKVIDGELIVIRLSDGTYYSMGSVATQVWTFIEAGHDLSTIVATLARWYDTPAGRVEPDVRAFVRELLAERLIAVVEPDSAPPPPNEAPTGLIPYEAPQVHIYRDMGNLLALDPPTPGIDDLLFGKPREE